MIGDLFDSPWKILIVAVVILVLFGSAKLPGAARSLGKSMRILKAEVKDFHEEEAEPATAGPGIAGPQPVTAQPLRPSRRDGPSTQAQRTVDLQPRRHSPSPAHWPVHPIGGIRPKRP